MRGSDMLMLTMRQGAVILFPKLVLQLKIQSIKDLTVEKLHVLSAFHPKLGNRAFNSACVLFLCFLATYHLLEVVIFGTGRAIKPLPREIGDFLRKHRINIDVMDTVCSFLNFLSSFSLFFFFFSCASQMRAPHSMC